MLNYEKYKEEILNQKNKPALCYVYEKILKMNCHDIGCVDCNNIALKFLFSEYKEPIKLTHDEYVVLKNIDKKYQWIVRDKNNDIFVYKHKPKKSDICCWYSDNWVSFIEFNHLFQFVKWEDEEPYNIKDLLDNCEVV